MINKICFVSDLHGHLPKIPDCDILCIVGDICPAYDHSISFQKLWLEGIFNSWIKWLNIPNVVFTPGNHDFIFQESPELIKNPPYYLLLNSSIEINGIKFWGSPFSTLFGNWVFMDTDERLQQYWEKIPPDTNVILTHGPAYSILDWSNYGDEHTGSKTLRDRILEVKPKIHACGHIHSEYGILEYENIKFINCSYLDDNYKPKNSPIVVNYEK